MDANSKQKEHEQSLQKACQAGCHMASQEGISTEITWLQVRGHHQVMLPTFPSISVGPLTIS